MADIDGVDEGIADQTADEADDPVRRQNPRGWKVIARGRRALNVVERFDEIIDAERNRGDENDAEDI